MLYEVITIIGVSIFVIPAYICLFVALNSPFLLINNGSQLSGITKPMLNDCTFEQYFVATMPTTDRIQLVAGTYGHKTVITSYSIHYTKLYEIF